MFRATEYFEMKAAEAKSANFFSALSTLGANLGHGGFNAKLKTPMPSQAPTAQTNTAINDVLARMGKPGAPAALAATPAAAPAAKSIPMRPMGVPANNPVALRRQQLAAQVG